MCTVTFIPSKSGFVLTSSRDEKVHRPTLKPKTYLHANTLLVYPKDEIAKGTWIASSENKKVACLLNGAYQNHDKKANYTKSRGQILIDCFGYNSFEDAIKNICLAGVEPFTLLLIDYKSQISFDELVWDGKKKHFQTRPNDLPQIWSSATLYSEQDQALRKNWFNKWIEKYKSSSDCNILNFHTEKHSNIESNDIIMKRENDLQTVSISQIKIGVGNESFFYLDLDNASNTTINLAELICTQE